MSATQETQFVHLSDVIQRPVFLQRWERLRHSSLHWLMECVAEFTGVFFYTYLGVASTASYTIGNLAGLEGAGSLLQIGFAYGFGIVIALVVCAATSGGHFSPGVTIMFAIFKGFPWRKAPMYIVSQILGGFVACLVVYLQWKEQFTTIEAALAAAGKLDAVNFTPQGPAGVIALYAPVGANLGFVFVAELFSDIFLGLVIAACLDFSNFFCPPVAAPYAVGLAYAGIVWGFAGAGVALNTARDVGGRLAALCIWGTQAAGGNYAALAALTNIPGLAIGGLIYELFFFDSHRVMTNAHAHFVGGHKAHAERRAGAMRKHSQSISDSHSMTKDMHDLA